MIRADRCLTLQGHHRQRLLRRHHLVFIQRAHQAQAIHQSHQLAVVFDDSLDADFLERAQLPLMNQHPLGKLRHHLGFCTHGQQQKVAQVFHWDQVQVIRGSAALCGDFRARKVRFDNPGQDGF
ncbi:hypothetical protein D3C86_1650250 [compost metagenome]